MGEQRTERRITAVLAADAVGFSRLMSEHEEITLNTLHACLKIFQGSIAAHGGRVFGGAGDSVVAEFPSALEAVRCALEAQTALARRNAEVATVERMQFRIGISVGDVIVEGDNLMGDGINVTSRLEGLADPGGINISGFVYHQVHNKVEAGFEDMGMQTLKNLPEPIHVYKVTSHSTVSVDQPHPVRASPAASPRRRLVVAGGVASLLAIAGAWFLLAPFSEQAGKGSVAQREAVQPSLLVLPFSNRSDDPSQDYFVDGITEDIITDFSRLSNLTVIAWNTSVSLKGKPVQPQELKKEFGVDHILDGSVRKVGDQLRITAELVDAGSGKQVWAERYDRKLTDVFALQDEVTKRIVQTLAIKLTAAEAGQMGRSATNNIAAYESFLRGQEYFAQQTKDGNQLARESFKRAIELDPTYARAYGGMALTLARDFQNGWTHTPNESLDRALDLAKQAVALGEDIPQTYWALGFVHMMRREFESAAAAVEKAISLAPNYADGYGLLALINNNLGKPKEALDLITKAMRLNPHYSFDYPYNLGRAYYLLGRYKEAIEALEKAQARNENHLPLKLFLTASYIRDGRVEDAKWLVEQIRLLSPETTLSQMEKAYAISNPELRKAFLADLRKAGLPE